MLLSYDSIEGSAESIGDGNSAKTDSDIPSIKWTVWIILQTARLSENGSHKQQKWQPTRGDHGNILVSVSPMPKFNCLTRFTRTEIEHTN